MQPYSGLIITYNEAHNIAACIASLAQVCDDIVVVDSGSSDDTVAIARAAGATVLVQLPFLGDGPQRSLGLPLCRHDWVINLDADERLEADLIATLQAQPEWPVDALECRRRNYIGDRFTPYAGQYPDYICRIFDRRRADFSPLKAHSRVQTKSTRKIEGHVTHYSYRDYDDMFARINKYSTWQAQEMFAQGKRASLGKAIAHGSIAFLKHYIAKRGFLAGCDGLSISLSKGLGSYLKYAKLIELQNRR
ncbi:glycosyl transferase family 2 [Jeongeupia sp. HS-3]|uniref:glycosyltransferase family 2 protein n=1 Tax=Jeongeupia sp. HS-3 TaxID=1009682 RepID=UPI0018A5E83A|nr:glycosyltransferase family 2 protein [Jeongeupia sp. HS-3]BCL76894.1 glycosyl transferase family 2 [Jeongeupia sp. HS-3]